MANQMIPRVYKSKVRDMREDQLNGATCQNDAVINLSSLANQIVPLGEINYISLHI